MSFWACAQVHPFKVNLALTSLAAVGFETYFPRIVESYGNRGKLMRRPAGLFPGYCFVLVRLQWHPIVATPGVMRLLRDGDRPARVSDAVIDAIRQREVDGLIQLPERQQLRPGARVRITGGAL